MPIIKMGKVKIHLEFKDHDGSKYTLSLDGILSKDKINKLADMAELLQGTSNKSAEELGADTIMTRIHTLIQHRYSFREFTSSNLLEAYEDVYNQPASLSLISTYLARITDRKQLIRRKNGAEWRYSQVTSQDH